MDKNTLVIACGAIANELVSLCKANDWQHLDIQCLPAQWHNTPEKITPAVELKIAQYRHQYAQIFVAYADCGTGGQLDAVLAKHGIGRLPGDHCYGFFAGQLTFNALAEAELGTFYLTDYLLDNFQRLLIEGLGIDRHPELLDQYFGHYRRLTYLRQQLYGEKCLRRLQQAENAAQSLGLELHIEDTGLEPFERSLTQLLKATHPIYPIASAH